MSSPRSNQNIQPVDPVQVPEVPADDNVPLQSPEVHAMEPANANVQGGQEEQANANLPVQPPVIQVVAPDGDDVPASSDAQNESSSGSSEGNFEEYLPHMVRMNLSLTSSSSPATSSKLGSSHTPTLSTDIEERSSYTGTPSSEGSVEGAEVTALTREQMITEVVSRLSDSSKESTSKTKTPEGSAEDKKAQKPITVSQVKAALSKIPRLPPLQKPAGLPVTKSPIPQQRVVSLPPIPGTTPTPQMKSSLAVLPPVAGSTEGYQPSEESKTLTKVSSDSSLSTLSSESVQYDSPKKQSLSVLPPVTGAHQPSDKSNKGLSKDSSDSSLSTLSSESVQYDSPKKQSLWVLPPVTGAHQPSDKSNKGLSKDSSESSISTSTSDSLQSESDSPKRPTHSAVDVLKRRDSSDGSKADDSNTSGGSPEQHPKKKTLYKRQVSRESTRSTPTPQPVRDEPPPLSRADTLDDVGSIRTDSISFHSNQGVFVRPLSPDRDRRAISLPADPPKKDPAMAPPDRRAYSEAKAQEMEVVPVPPPQSLDTSISWPSSDPVDLPSEVKSEPVKRVTEKVAPTLQAISEGHPPLPAVSSEQSPCVPEMLMDEFSTEVVAYAGDLSASNSDINPRLIPRRDRRRVDEDADRQMMEFNQAVAEAQRVSSGRGTDSDPPLTTLDSSTENRMAPVLAGYQGWLRPGDDGSLSLSSSDSSGNRDVQMMQGWIGGASGSQDQPGPSGVGRPSKDTLSVISEKGESLSPSSVSGSMSPSEMEGVEEIPKTQGEDESLEPSKKSEDVEMVESSSSVAAEKDPKSRLMVNLKDEGSPRTPKRKRETKKSTDTSPKDPELLSPGEEKEKKKYCSEFNRPVMTGQIARSSSTGSVKPDQCLKVDVEGFKKLAEKRRKSQSPGAEDPKDPKEDPKDDKSEKKDPEDKKEPSA